MRFYFSFIFGEAGTITRIGEEQFYSRNIESSLEQFISRRLEGLSKQYFHRMAVMEKYKDIEDYGSYQYDDPITKTNKEFDCVIKRLGTLYDFYECKYFDRPLTKAECVQKREQLKHIRKIEVSGIAFVCTGGFNFKDKHDFILVDGDSLYQDFETAGKADN